MKKALSLFLALALCLSLCAVPACAEEEFVISSGILTAYNGPGGHVVIPDGVTMILGAFRDCTTLTSVVIPEGVTMLMGAFSGCTALTDVQLPSSLTSFKASDFQGTPWLASLGEFPVANGILLGYNGTAEQVVIPVGVTKIADSAFSFKALKSVTIPDSVTAVGSFAFSGCAQLSEVNLPETLTDFGGSAFSYTPWLASLGDPAVVNGVLLSYTGDAAELTVPAGVKRISALAISNLNTLETLVLPEGLTVIDSSGISDCPALKRVYIPASVTSLGIMTLFDCNALTDIWFGGTQEQWAALTTSTFGKAEIHYESDAAALGAPAPERPEFEYDTVTFKTWDDSNGWVDSTYHTLVRYNGAGGRVVIPQEAEAIGAKAFYGCADLTEVVLHKGVRHIGDSAFYHCGNLKSVKNTDGLTSLWNNAFSGCSSLESLELPARMQYIGSGAFSLCYGLKRIRLPSAIVIMGDSVFFGCSALDGVSVSNGGYAIFTYPLTIDSATFRMCSALSRIFVPKTVKSIKANAFAGCDALRHIYFDGTRAQWEAIEIDETGNEALKNATVHYNCARIVPPVIRSPQKLTVDGVQIDCEKYNIDGSNYFKLRDLAKLLSGTGSQFSVSYDASSKTVVINTGEAYTPDGSELAIGEDKSATAVVSAQNIQINGKNRYFLNIYNIGGNNYFKLRELGDELGFDVDYDKATNTAIVLSR